jgi:hypothetical protein
MKYKIILLLATLLTIIGCGDTPIFTEMKTNRLKIVIKGTFETEGASNFVAMSSKSLNYTVSQDDTIQDLNSVDDVPTGSDDAFPTTFMLDIAEIRLNGAKISDYRQVFTIPLEDSHPFFNGTGIELVTDDPGAGNYDSVQLYIRKMSFNNAKLYQLVGNTFSYEKDAEFIFKEKTVNGFDFNQLSVNSYWDSLRTESSEIIRVFPLQIPIIGGMTYTKDNGETVLEIRLVVKNFIKKYEFDFYSGGVYKVCHYYALSDWLRDVKAGESDIGRNLHAVARAYVPGKTGTIIVSNPSGGYVIAIPSSETAINLNKYYITNSGVALRTNVGDSDLPLPPSYPGAYIEPILDYYLKYEKYKSDWNGKTQSVDGGTCTSLSIYSGAWDVYETAVRGSIDGSDAFGFRIPPYVGYGTSVTFSNMAQGTYNFYRLAQPAYGSLFVALDDAAFAASPLSLNKVIVEGTNTGI